METYRHTKNFNSKAKAQNQELAVDRCMHPRMTGMHNKLTDDSGTMHNEAAAGS